MDNPINLDIKTLDSITKDEFDEMMKEGYNQAVEGKGINIDLAFDELRKRV